jgi:hypothetical protein
MAASDEVVSANITIHKVLLEMQLTQEPVAKSPYLAMLLRT